MNVSLHKIWDLKTYKIKSDLPGHTDEVYCVDFVADKVVSGGRDRTVKMWVDPLHFVRFWTDLPSQMEELVGQSHFSKECWRCIMPSEFTMGWFKYDVDDVFDHLRYPSMFAATIVQRDLNALIRSAYTLTINQSYLMCKESRYIPPFISAHHILHRAEQER